MTEMQKFKIYFLRAPAAGKLIELPIPAEDLLSGKTGLPDVVELSL
jgi:hypothetical protein